MKKYSIVICINTLGRDFIKGNHYMIHGIDTNTYNSTSGDSNGYYISSENGSSVSFERNELDENFQLIK